VYEGRVFNLVVDDVEYASGNRSVREIAEHPGGAVALPMFEDGTILMVRQLRYPINTRLLELPAGKLSPGEDPLHCATRELEEETGYRAASWEKLTAIYTTPGFCSEQLHLFLARGLQLSEKGRALEEGELSMTVDRIPFADALDMVEMGRIVDGKTICGLFLAERLLNREGRKA
jgi:ADP-ribose pyrophosphatase